MAPHRDYIHYQRLHSLLLLSTLATKYFRWDMIVLRSLLLTRRDKGIYAQTWRYPPGSVTYKLYMSYNMFSIIIGHIIHDQQQLPCIDSKCFYEQHRLTSTPWIYGGTYLNLHLRRCLTSYCTLCKKILIIKKKESCHRTRTHTEKYHQGQLYPPTR